MGFIMYISLLWERRWSILFMLVIVCLAAWQGCYQQKGWSM